MNNSWKFALLVGVAMLAVATGCPEKRCAVHPETPTCGGERKDLNDAGPVHSSEPEPPPPESAEAPAESAEPIDYPSEAPEHEDEPGPLDSSGGANPK
jgi:hypothetical protein